MAFDARETIFGALTAANPTLVIRTWDSPEFRDKFRALIEIRGGDVDLSRELSKVSKVNVAPTEPRTAGCNAWTVEFLDPGALLAVPVLRALADLRNLSQRGLVQYEGGGGTLRLELLAEPGRRPQLLSELRSKLEDNGVVASIRIEEMTETLESWNPRPPVFRK